MRLLFVVRFVYVAKSKLVVIQVMLCDTTQCIRRDMLCGLGFLKQMIMLWVLFDVDF